MATPWASVRDVRGDQSTLLGEREMLRRAEKGSMIEWGIFGHLRGSSPARPTSRRTVSACPCPCP